ncbi:type IV secretory system conjugative DNA transfer family protein [Nocardioides terrisoli]|uniref:type IV secretory system conjugative DNA transfer family protein n=1 Tax=Nocardioides terrisoli TaxID=3388267 RepID=UPI00287B80FD|nr:type IV secretory system conjugative DNA transfer family protein [Nocardioides marmorisolisilvae]
MSGREETVSSDALAIGILIIGGVVGVVAGGCWLAAQASLLLVGRSGASAPFSGSPSFVVQLIRDRQVTAAWDTAYPDAASLVPAAFWSVLAVLILLIAVGAALGILGWQRRTQPSQVDPARWATRRTQRRLAVPADPAKRRWRLVAGRALGRRMLLAGHDCVSAVVFGPNGSGKTTGLIVPNVLDWDGPVVITTAKPQDLQPLCAARAVHGPVWVIAPGGAPGHQLAGWSPIDAAVDAEAADRLAEWMVDSSGMADDPKARPWNAQARKYLKGLLLAAHLSGDGIAGWVEWIHAGERARDHVEDLLRTAGEDGAAQDYASTWQIHEEGKGSVLFTALGIADTYSRPGILTAARAGGFTPADLFDRAGTLCVVVPNADGDRFAPYFTTLLSAIIHTAEQRAARQGGPIEPRLLLALDEAGNVFRYPRLPHLLTTSRGNGIQLLLIYHDLAQLEHLYGGRSVARTVVSNAKMRMLLPGVADLDTLRYWSDLMGQTRTHSHGTTTGGDGRRSRSRNEHTDHLAPLHLLQQLPDGQAVLLYQNLPPARVRLLPWYAERRFRHLRDAP